MNRLVLLMSQTPVCCSYGLGKFPPGTSNPFSKFVQLYDHTIAHVVLSHPSHPLHYINHTTKGTHSWLIGAIQVIIG